MGLADVTPDDSGSSSRSDGSSSSSSSSGPSTTVSRKSLSGVGPGDFPVDVVKTPHLVIKETDDGYETVRYPHTKQCEVTYTWYATMEFTPVSDWAKWFWSEDNWKAICRRVKLNEGVDLDELVDEAPGKALKAIQNAANEHISQTYKNERDCAVCGETLHLYHDDFETVGNRKVCPCHNVEELAAADLI